MNPFDEYRAQIARRHFFGQSARGLGALALASLLDPRLRADDSSTALALSRIKPPHFTATAKRVIYLFQSGAPSQLDLFDYKPRLAEFHKHELPDSIRQGQRLTGMTSGQASFPVVASKFKFAQRGDSGMWLSDLLPHTAKIVDDLTFIRSMHTEAINHDPAITFMETGSQQPGRPSMGSWVDYGLGSENEDLPAFVAMISKTSLRAGQGLLARLWGNGFLPSQHQGVKLRAGGDPVLYLSNPKGIDETTRRDMVDGIAQLNRIQQKSANDPEITARIA